MLNKNIHANVYKWGNNNDGLMEHDDGKNVCIHAMCRYLYCIYTVAPPPSTFATIARENNNKHGVMNIVNGID